MQWKSSGGGVLRMGSALGDISISLYDLAGRRIAGLYEGRVEANQTIPFSLHAGRHAQKMGILVVEINGERFFVRRAITMR